MPPVREARLYGWVFKLREDLVDRHAWEARGEELRSLLSIAISSMRIVAGLDL